ncbi:MAG TPA: S8 family serine peptidase [Mycobacteriales bacterium]|nr:S8 family serine peptidase [Mycobacteriales bacterium]
MRLLRPLLVLLLLAAAAPSSFGAPAGDPLRSQQWGLDQVRAPEAWKLTRGRGAIVAVVDSGVDLSHPDLKGRLVPGVTFLNCLRPCGNGDWRSPSTSPFGHGTAVAGVVAAGAGNGGIVGVAPEAKVMPVRIGGEGMFDDGDIARGIRWAVTHGADVINLSLNAADDGTVRAAVAYAIAHDVVVVAAAGNGSFPLCAHPGDIVGALCVTATGPDGLPSGYSSAGLAPGLGTIAAPGGAAPPRGVPLVLSTCGDFVMSTWPKRHPGGSCTPGPGWRGTYGTSLAAPHVAGVAALLRSQGRSAAETVEILLATAKHPGGVMGGFTPYYGHGVVDAAAAVRAPR